MLPFCNADVDEGKVLFSACVSGFPLPRATALPLSCPCVSPLTCSHLPWHPCACVWQPRSVLLRCGGAARCVWPSRDVSPCWGGSEPRTVAGPRGPRAAVARGDPRFPPHGVALGSALQRHEAVPPLSPLSRPQNTLPSPPALATCSHCAQHPQPTLGDPETIPGLAGNAPHLGGCPGRR